MNWMTILRFIGPTIVKVIIPKVAEWLEQLIVDAIAESEAQGGSGKEKLDYATKIVLKSTSGLEKKDVESAISATVDATNKVYAHKAATER